MRSQWIKGGGLLCSAAILAAGAYLFVSSQTAGLGFPLDDAWIHQTYARNLGRSASWAFIPGQVSAGSTSPLWSALLALGYALGLVDGRAWTYLLGTASLAGVAVLGERFYRDQIPLAETKWGWLPWAGFFLAGEYHLVWAAVSGMETDFMAAFFLAGLVLLSGRRQRNWLQVGALAGLACWVRPDGLTILGPALLLLMVDKERRRGLVRLAAGFGLLFGPYLLFNLLMQGNIWPNTFYAKQAEYAVLQNRAFLLRFGDELALPLVGAGLLLLPGFLFYIFRTIRERNAAGIAAWLWCIGYAFLYAWRLPVTYQYGRYLIPAMPVYFVLGLAGLELIRTAGMEQKAGRLLAFGWRVALVGVWMGFLGMGSGRYARDVGIIETEMVAAARWVAVNTPPQALIAAHDIGAMGYFGNRPIVDLAGLITPDVIPIIRDEKALSAYLDAAGVTYLVVFPGWYAELPAGKTILFSAPGAYSPEHITVFRWR